MSAIFLISPNEKLIFLENISTKDDAARRCFPKRTTDGATYFTHLNNASPICVVADL
jgi:hypothetical protein